MYVHSKYGVDRTGKPVFEAYDDNVHCVEKELLTEIEKEKKHSMRAGQPPEQAVRVEVRRIPIYIGWDNTGRNPAVVVAQKSDDGQWVVQYEKAAQGLGMKAFAEEVRLWLAATIPGYRIISITTDPAGEAKDSGELSMRMIVAQAFPGVPVVEGPHQRYTDAY